MSQVLEVDFEVLPVSILGSLVEGFEEGEDADSEAVHEHFEDAEVVFLEGELAEEEEEFAEEGLAGHVLGQFELLGGDHFEQLAELFFSELVVHYK